MCVFKDFFFQKWLMFKERENIQKFRTHNHHTEEGMSVIHTFSTTGTYSITARAIYESGIEKTETIPYQVK